MAKRPGDDYDRDLMDIIPERYDADADSRQARAGHRLRGWVLIGGAVIAVGAIVATGLHFVGGRRGGGMGVPVIRADDKPIKTRPDDRGGMQVPNQDKLVYERMDSAGASEPTVERLLPQPEAAKAPPKTISVPPLSAEPPPAAQMAPQAMPQRPAPVPPKPGEPPAPKTAPQAKVAAQPMALPPAEAPVAEAPAAVQPMPERKAAPAQPEHMAPAVVAQAPRVAPPPPPPAAASPAKAPPSGEYVVQLGAVRAADQAEREWARISKANADLLGGLKPDIVRVDLPGKGTFWRIRAASMSEQAARQLCAELASRSQGCIVAKR